MTNVKNDYNFPVELRPIYLEGGTEITNRRAVVRTDTMQPLGVVSPTYGLVRHASIIDAFRDAAAGNEFKEKVGLVNHGANLFYQMTFPKIQIEARKNDLLSMMLIIKNSYNGGSGLQVIFGAYRLVCENGLILGTSFMAFMYRHVGEVGGLRDEKEIERYKQAYTNYIQLFKGRLPVINAMVQKTLKSPVEELFDAKQVRLPQYLLDDARSEYTRAGKNTVWDYYNSMTYAVTHKLRKENPARSVHFGTEAWRVAEKRMSA